MQRDKRQTACWCQRLVAVDDALFRKEGIELKNTQQEYVRLFFKEDAMFYSTTFGLTYKL